MFFMVESLTQNTGHLSSLILAKKTDAHALLGLAFL